jgi:UDP-3-O-[3-hydroxymyristoyl] glucosamine N-acyltransferase
MYTLLEICRFIGGELAGESNKVITGAASLESAGDQHITFADNRKKMLEASNSSAGAIIVPRNCKELGCSVIMVDKPRLAFIQILRLFEPKLAVKQGIHPSVIIGEGVQLGKDVIIHASVVIDDFVVIGDRVELYPGVYIGQQSRIEEGSVIYAGTVIKERVYIGKRVIIQPNAVIGSDGFGYERDGTVHVKVPHIGTVIIEDDAEIGAGTTIDRGTCEATRIGRGTKIDNLVQIAHNVQIGERCLIAAQNGLAGSAVLGNDVTMAGQAGTVGHIHVGDRSIVMSCSRVTKDLPADSLVSGDFGREHSEQLRINAAINQLPKILHRLSALEKERTMV